MVAVLQLLVLLVRVEYYSTNVSSEHKMTKLGFRRALVLPVCMQLGTFAACLSLSSFPVISLQSLSNKGIKCPIITIIIIKNYLLIIF